MKIYVIRHGLTKLNKDGAFNGHIDESLSPEGIEQANNAIHLIPASIKKMYASSLIRTKQTAEILNSIIKVPISYVDELKEVNAGVLNGLPFTDEGVKKYKALQYNWKSQGGESVEDVMKRVLKVLDEIKLKERDEEVLIVTHGGIIRILYFLEKGSLLDEIGNVSILSFDLDKILINSSDPVILMQFKTKLQ